jgi:hypothetical protein
VTRENKGMREHIQEVKLGRKRKKRNLTKEDIIVYLNTPSVKTFSTYSHNSSKSA